MCVCVPDVVHAVVVQPEAVCSIRSIHEKLNVLSNAENQTLDHFKNHTVTLADDFALFRPTQ